MINKYRRRRSYKFVQKGVWGEIRGIGVNISENLHVYSDTVTPGFVLYRFRGVTTMTITIRPSWNFLCIIKNSTLPTSWHNKGIFAISQCIWKLKLFYLKSNSDITCFWLSLFNMCISTCFLFTSVKWCNVPVHLKFIHKVKYHF